MIELQVLRSYEMQAEQFNSELFSELTLMKTGAELDKKLFELTRIKALPSPHAVNDLFDESFSSGEIGEIFRNNECYDVLHYAELKGHKSIIKIEKVFKYYFIRELRNNNVRLHKPVNDYAAYLARMVIFGKYSVFKEVIETCFKTEADFGEKIKLLTRILHDDFDVPMYVIFPHLAMLFPQKLTLVENLSLVSHQNDSESDGAQAHYDQPQVTGKNLVNQDRIKRLVAKVTTSNTFKNDKVAHTDMNNGILVSASVGQVIDPIEGSINECSLFLVLNTSLHIKNASSHQ